MNHRIESRSVETGKLLIAEPFMLDPHFKRSVVLLADHDKDEGTVGFILNRKTGLKLNELTEDFGEFEADVFTVDLLTITVCILYIPQETFLTIH